MSFLISKIAWGLASPGSLLLILSLVGFACHSRRPGLSRSLLGLTVAFLAAAALLPLSHWAISPLEERFPVTQLPAEVDGIIVLGGAIDFDNSRLPDRVALSNAAGRVTSAVALARRYPHAKLVYSGGSGRVRDQQLREADLARPMLESMGVDSSRVLYDRESRNTWENALYSKKAANPKRGEIWLLVTSAWHMPRSMGCFRKVGWDVTPYPVNYLGNSRWADFEILEQLNRISVAEREWIGLVAYHLLGRTDAWFPAPLTTD